MIFLENTNLCNFRCRFCPTGDHDLIRKVGRPKGTMSMALHHKIVDDLKEFDRKLKLINFYKDGEPLLDETFPERVSYLKKANVAERIWTKTNGSRLNPEFNQRICEAGLDMICISVESVSSSGYKRIAGANIDYDRLRDNVADLYSRRGKCEIYAKLVNVNLSQQDIDKFYADFQPISSYVGIENLMGWSYSGIKDFTLGTMPTTYDGLPLTAKEVCTFPFYIMAINFNGTVSVCNEDWSHSTIVGDATKQSLKEIWEGDALFRFREMLLECRRRENRACGDCHYLLTVPDNIDAHRLRILQAIRNARSDSTLVTAQSRTVSAPDAEAWHKPPQRELSGKNSMM